jgi:hypothetical protein
MAISGFVKQSTLVASTFDLFGVSGLVGANSAQAAILNGGFESGNFSGWNTIGNATIQTSSFDVNPTEGTFQALLNTDDPVVSSATIESFLGLASGSLNSAATEGSAIKQSITVNAGDILTFNWNFLTDENTPSFFNDFVFLSVTNATQLADTFFISFNPGGFNQQTGYQPFSFTFASAGTYTLGFGVMDVGDTAVRSGLLLDQVAVTPIPTPALLPGLVGLGLGGWRKRKGPVAETSTEA